MPAFSVTDSPCKCGLLERSANDQELPIFFDEEANEYYFDTGKRKIRLLHCFVCGGKAPESHRARLFAAVANDEIARLSNLTKDIKSLEEAISRLGPPGFEAPQIETHISRNSTTPEVTRSFRSLTWFNLSETAEVIITDRQEGGIITSFQGKYIGRRRKKRKKGSD